MEDVSPLRPPCHLPPTLKTSLPIVTMIHLPLLKLLKSPKLLGKMVLSSEPNVNFQDDPFSHITELLNLPMAPLCKASTPPTFKAPRCPLSKWSISPSENCLKPQKSGSKWLPRRSHPLPEAACQLSRRSILHSPTQSDRSSRSAGERHWCRFWSISCCWWFRWYVDQNGSQFLLSFSILNAAVYACQALLGENTLHACWFPNWLAADSKNWSSALNLQLRVLWIAIIAPERKSTKYHQKCLLHWISKRAEKTSNQASQIPVIEIRIFMRKICCFLKILESWKMRRAEIKLMDEVCWIKNRGGLMCWIGWWPMLQIHFFAAMHCCRVFTRDILVAAMHQCNASNSVLGWDQNAIHCQLCCCSFTRGIFQLWLNRN